LAFVALAFFFSGLDDFFIDLFYIVRSTYRRLFVLPKFQPLTEEHLLLPGEQLIAILIPAWDESLVIGRMLENALRTLNYSRYHIFVGTYPNDPGTILEVERVRENYDNVHRMECPDGGPTSKADCLNRIYQGVRSFEETNGLRFEILVLHDSEDVVHPLSLRLFNYLIPRKDMVQLPVFSLEAKWYQWTAGHYMDEFAEYHLKDLLVRERLAGLVPGAGVGCAYSHRAIELVAAEHGGKPFSTDSLTEDYDFSFRLKKHNLKEIFVKQAITRAATRRSFWSGRPRVRVVKEFIATREYFPMTPGAAVRQKSRWIFGIAYQGWASIGWKGDGWTKYMLFRDRKALLTNQINALGYVVVLTVVSLWLANRYLPDSYRYPPLVEGGTWLWYLILADTFFLLWRLFQRVVNVYRIYGWQHSVLAAPRVIWANCLNFAAAFRALAVFPRYAWSGRRLKWEKTKHSFPTQVELAAFHSRLGELLVEKRHVTSRQLEEALSRQRGAHRPLGSILVEMGLVGEDELVQVLGLQLRLSPREIDPYQTPLELLEILPRATAVKYSVYPLELRADGALVVATDSIVTVQQLEQLKEAVERKVELSLCTRSDVGFAIRRGYDRLSEADEKRDGDFLGRRLLERDLITPAQLKDALKVQRRSYQRLGDILVREGILTPAQLDEALARFTAHGRGLLGEFLVQEDYISLQELRRALDAQATAFRRLGEVLVAQKYVSRHTINQVLESPA
jgi:adsorption protein B